MNIKLRLAVGVLGIAFLNTGCNKPSEPTKDSRPLPKLGGDDDHDDHGDGPHGGTIFEFGGKYHGEFCEEHKAKRVVVYIYDSKIKNLAPISADKLVMSIKKPQFTVELKPEPEATDPKGKSSKFVATHDNFAVEQDFEGTVTAVIDGKPYSGDFKEKAAAPDEKKKSHGPADGHGDKVAKKDSQEAEIYLKPGGSYTEADIKANGNTTVSAKYKGLKVSHDIEPKPGDKLCPVTLTKSNEKLTWIVGGKTYEFCCPPCVEEFVELAKTKPAEVKEPGEYIKK